MKRYRNEKGHLIITLEQLKKETFKEAMDYYQPGKIYLNAEDGQEYVFLMPAPGDGDLVHFQSFSGKNLFTSMQALGTFLPDVASEGMELTLVE